MAIIGAAAIPVVAALAGLGIAAAELVSSRSRLQNALDAAVLIGAGEGSVEAQTAAAERAFLANYAPASDGVRAVFDSDGAVVHGTGEVGIRNLFHEIVGPPSIIVRGAATAKKMPTPLCVLALNPQENGAFDIQGSPDFSAPACAVHANSRGGRGMSQVGRAATAEAKLWAVTGGAATYSFRPAPSHGAAAVADPYAGLPFPPTEPCPAGASARRISADATLEPGTYCGGIDVTGSGTVLTLRPGIYVMANGPLRARGGAAVTGEQVMIAFTGDDATLRMRGNASLRVTSPISGEYANMQFFQDRDDPMGRGATATIGGSAGDGSRLQYDGVAYFPTQKLSTYGNVTFTANSPTLAIVADEIWFQGNPTVRISREDRRSLKLEGPSVPGRGVVLIR